MERCQQLSTFLHLWIESKTFSLLWHRIRTDQIKWPLGKTCLYLEINQMLNLPWLVFWSLATIRFSFTRSQMLFIMKQMGKKIHLWKKIYISFADRAMYGLSVNRGPCGDVTVSNVSYQIPSSYSWGCLEETIHTFLSRFRMCTIMFSVRSVPDQACNNPYRDFAARSKSYKQTLRTCSCHFVSNLTPLNSHISLHLYQSP